MSRKIKQAWIGEIEDTPLGTIWTAVSAKGLVAVSLWDDRERFEAEVEKLTDSTPIYEPERITVAAQIRQYLNKERQKFDLEIDWSIMTPFQELALRAVVGVEYGRTATYADIARQIGKPKAVRAVGRANATNPMPLVIPCHRILGSDGKLHGFSAPGGLETKAGLLQMEGSWLI
ncbi:MAG: methylated-DNA--[protein]-cysteine S-methyltransferase [Chloroflexi bacterium]|nr:methylated-DNA--[protein]-cysteine S-methyltransferase [Chloroflexota bacterium]